MSSIELKHIVKKYGDGFPAVNDVNLDIKDGEFVILVGPSGCGKSTLLRMIVGLEDITSGDMEIDGKRVNDLAPRDRNLAMVFQNYALYPHLTVFENIAFPLRLQKGKHSNEEIDRKVREASTMLELDEHLERKPGNLSGGQRQRVAMGRAIVRQADAFLFDEPLSNLDAKLRVQTRTQIASLQRRLGVTTVYVTHDQVEAMTMGDRVAVLKDGVLQQLDTPRRMYDHPNNVFVAGFIGSPAMNLLEVPVTDVGIKLGSLVHPVDRATLAKADTTVTVGIRPEDLVPTTEGGIPVEVDVVEELGADAYIYGRTTIGEQGGEKQLGGLDDEKQIVARVDGRQVPDKGQTIHFAPKGEGDHLHLFHPKTGERIES